MGDYAGELPSKFISFQSLENESNVPKDHNTEGTENYLDLPQRSAVEIVVIEETETSPTKSLAVLQVTGGKETMVEERGDVNKECLTVGSQECLMSSSDEGSEGLEKFLRDKLESLGGDGIENTVEVDPDGVLELLDANLMDRGNPGSGVVTVDDEIPRSRLDWHFTFGVARKDYWWWKQAAIVWCGYWRGRWTTFQECCIWGPEWVRFPCSCPSFRFSEWYSCLNRLGLFAALGPLQHFSGGWFVRWQWGQGGNDLDVEGFIFWFEGSFLCSCSFLILLRQSRMTWPGFLQ